MEVAAFILGTIGFAGGLLGLWISWLARKDTHEQAKQAKIANDTAAEALVQASVSVRLAEEANEVARRANEIAAQSERRAGDTVTYEWRFEVDDGGFPVAVVNDSAQDAFDVAVVIDAGGDPVVTLADDHVLGFGSLLVDIAEAREKYLGEVRRQKQRATAWFGNTGTGYRSEIVTGTFRATIKCVTPSGTPRHGMILCEVRYRKEGGQLVRVGTK